MKKPEKNGYSEFHAKILWKFLGNAVISVIIVKVLYFLIWKRRMGDWIIRFLETVFHMSWEKAYFIYDFYFRGNKDILFLTTILFIFFLLLWRFFRWMNRYFDEINSGIDALLKTDEKPITLSPEMIPFEHKLNAVKQTLNRQKAETWFAEQRKDELVMYLAHDIRTPLTSVIGYLNLLCDNPTMPAGERAKHLLITLEKAYRLEDMINEFFEITRYNSQQIALTKQNIDLYYMLVQLSDELSPLLSPHGNSVVLNVKEDLFVYADPDKLARVFGNILKNAAAYSYPNTAIVISVLETDTELTIYFQNEGDTIPAEKLASLFDKFYRLDKARSSGTGGTGLGLAIAKDIIRLHGGDIYAESKNNTVTFSIRLPKFGKGPET